MTEATVPAASIAVLLKDEARFPAELEHLKRSELESLRSAIERVLTQRAADSSDSAERTEDTGFSCEWWPPN